ncbi:MAG: PAC2 family protein [Methanophagales archaeon]|nr:PAC2 family protein [Methanophagales archaeon]MCW7069930.1 PAC2 family protein [Methanophagales archaeon]
MEEFRIEEISIYWNVDEEKFKDKISKHLNIMVAGFPPLGNIIPYHLKELLSDSEKIMSFYSYNFPPMVEAQDEEFVIPHDELWYSEEKRLFCYIGKYPETEYLPKSAYKQAEGLARVAKELYVRELYTVGVVMPFQQPFRNTKPGIEAYVGYFEGSHKELPPASVKMTRKNIGRYTIIRKTGLLPGFASKLGIESYSILGVGKYPEDLRACAGALRAFKRMSGLELETGAIEKMLRESAEAVEERIKQQIAKSTSHYRGDGVGADTSQYMYG